LLPPNYAASEYFFIQTRSGEKLLAPQRWLPKNAFNYFALSLCNNFYNSNNYINYNVMINEDVWLMAPRPDFAAQYSHGHAKEFLRKLSTIWARSYEKVRQPSSGYITGMATRRFAHVTGAARSSYL
jgi:hypothetical protein